MTTTKFQLEEGGTQDFKGQSLLLIDYGGGGYESIVVLSYWDVTYITSQSQFFDITNKTGNLFTFTFLGTGISENFVVKRIDIAK